MVPGSFGCGSAVLAAMVTLAPSRAARSAIARPMPREPPEMKIVLLPSDMKASSNSLTGCNPCASADRAFKAGCRERRLTQRRHGGHASAGHRPGGPRREGKHAQDPEMAVLSGRHGRRHRRRRLVRAAGRGGGDALDRDRRAAGKGVRHRRRPAPLPGILALGRARSQHQIHLRRPADRGRPENELDVRQCQCRQRQPDHHRIRPAEARRLRTRFRPDGQVAGDLGPGADGHRHQGDMGLQPASSTASPRAGSA